VGERTAQVLADHFGSMDRLMAASKEELETIPDIGPVVARSIHDWFSEPRNQQVLERLRQAGLRMQEQRKAAAKEAKLAGMQFVLTGRLETLTRDEATRLIERLGGRVSSSVSKKTSYVVVGEEAGSKLDRARELGIRTLTEKEFLALTQD
jgi:DNA ligase (NAD+)